MQPLLVRGHGLIVVLPVIHINWRRQMDLAFNAGDAENVMSLVLSVFWIVMCGVLIKLYRHAQVYSEQSEMTAIFQI